MRAMQIAALTQKAWSKVMIAMIGFMIYIYMYINLYLSDIFHYNSNDDDTNLEAGHDGEGSEAERHHVGDRGHGDRDASVSHGLANLERSIKLPSSDHHKKVCKTC